MHCVLVKTSSSPLQMFHVLCCVGKVIYCTIKYVSMWSSVSLLQMFHVLCCVGKVIYFTIKYVCMSSSVSLLQMFCARELY